MIEFDKNVDFLVLEPSLLSRGKSYNASVNGESAGISFDRIELKNYIINRFPQNKNQLIDLFDFYKTFLLDFKNGEVDILKQKETPKESSNILTPPKKIDLDADTKLLKGIKSFDGGIRRKHIGRSKETGYDLWGSTRYKF